MTDEKSTVPVPGANREGLRPYHQPVLVSMGPIHTTLLASLTGPTQDAGSMPNTRSPSN